MTNLMTILLAKPAKWLYRNFWHYSWIVVLVGAVSALAYCVPQDFKLKSQIREAKLLANEGCYVNRGVRWSDGDIVICDATQVNDES